MLSGILICVIAFALIFEFINGFHDTANAIATMAAAISAIGPAYITPSIPINLGKIRTKGIKNSTCLVSETAIPNFAFPIDVKNPEDIGCIPFIKVINIKIRKYRSANWKYSSSPEPNKLMIGRGNI